MTDFEEAEEIRTRIKGAFASSYLTLLSIIQGTALAALLLKVDALIHENSFHSVQIALAVGIFLAIVAVWNQYQMGLSLYSWTAQLVDSVIPFVLGIFEFVMIILMESGAAGVLVTLGLFFLVALCGFEYQYLQVRRNTAPDSFVHTLNSGFRALDAGSCLASALILFATAAIISRFGTTPGQQLAGAWVFLIISLSQLAREAYQWRVAQQRLAAVK